MSDVCQICGLPSELCVCETIAKEQQKIQIRTVRRRYGKKMTVIEGIDEKQIDLKELGKELKQKLACGGTSKKGQIELQGGHSEKVKKMLVEMGFSPELIEVR
jgi:translation initiation factor 1